MKINEVTEPKNPHEHEPEQTYEPGVWPSSNRPWKDFPKTPRDFSAPEAPSLGKEKASPEEIKAFQDAWAAYSKHPGVQAYHKELTAHNKAQQDEIAKLHASRGNFDTYLTIRNPKFDPEGDDGGLGLSGEEDATSYDEPEEIEVGVDYSISGRFYPATQYEPAEYPELEITKIVDLDTGENITDAISGSEWEAIEEMIWDEVNERGNDYDEPDDYYDESVQLEAIKRLSGLK